METSFGVGDEVFRGKRTIRRKTHHPVAIAMGKELLSVNKIRHSRRGISIFCTVQDIDHQLMVEHFDIWFFPNAKEKLKEYFDRLPQRSRRALPNGRLKDLHGYVCYGRRVIVEINQDIINTLDEDTRLLVQKVWDDLDN